MNNTDISKLSAIGVNGGFVAANDGNEIGSPGMIINEPVDFSAVAAGDATTNDAILWTRTFDPDTQESENVALIAQVSTDANFGTVAYSYNVSARTDGLDHDGTIKIDATALQSGTQYYYRFVSETGDISPVGTFKTAPDADASVAVRFGFSGDADGKMRPYVSTENFSSLNLDFFGFLGDTIYESASTGSPAAANPVTDPTQALDDYHRKYLENIQPVSEGGFSSLATMFASQGNYTLLDNHELGNKQLMNGGAPSALAPASGNGSSNTADDVNTTGTFINDTVGFQTLVQAYSDYQPIREQIISAPNDPRTDGTQQLFFAQEWGKNLVYINTDTRSYRDVRLKTADGAEDTGSRADNPDRTLLGVTQLAWLKQTLLDAQNNGTVWKFVAVSDPIDQIGAIGSGEDSGKSWIGGYRAERNDLLKFIADNGIKNVVFLATDDHQNRVNELTYLDNINDPNSIRILPNALAIVDSPIGATGPDEITDHSFENIKSLADQLAADQIAANVNPVGLDPNFPGLKNVVREGDLNADTLRQPIDFYSPDTFNYTVFDISADGKTLNVNVQGVNSYPINSFPEPSADNPVRSILSFSLDAALPPVLVTGTPGDDKLIATPGSNFDGQNNIVFTGAGEDEVDLNTSAQARNNRINLGSGNDIIYVSQSDSEALLQADRVFGSNGNDTFDATDGNGGNRMSGGVGNDTFWLGSNDRALGGDGNDQFYVQEGGGNLLSGGVGNDQFWIVNAELANTSNTIVDFQVGIDVIGINGAASLGITTSTLQLNQVGTDTAIVFNNQTLAVLNGIQSSSLNLTDTNQFVLV
ncbi:alkaline phosphatase D family protein [Anabaena sp. PCC 7108]|uniref:alkaline phosphatase D family protein n=1 Tax=Anabaena sp. PCC 7108 TaxID=163908 RepID=UPI00034C0026